MNHTPAKFNFKWPHVWRRYTVFAKVILTLNNQATAVKPVLRSHLWDNIQPANLKVKIKS
jgi:hypothetical protein